MQLGRAQQSWCIEGSNINIEMHSYKYDPQRSVGNGGDGHGGDVGGDEGTVAAEAATTEAVVTDSVTMATETEAPSRMGERKRKRSRK
jgi:hypothetical protein